MVSILKIIFCLIGIHYFICTQIFARWKVTAGYVLSDYPAGYPIKNCQWGRTSGYHLFFFYNKSPTFAVLFIARCSSLKRSSRIRITASSSNANAMFLCMRTQHSYRRGLRILNLIAFIWLIPWLSKLYKQSTKYKIWFWYHYYLQWGTTVIAQLE